MSESFSSNSSSEAKSDAYGCYTRDVSIDCRGRSPQLLFKPVYHICWGYRRIPSTINYIVGPANIQDPVACFGWPTSEVSGTMSRGTLDGFGACYAAWSAITGTGFRINFAYGNAQNEYPISTVINRASLIGEFSIGIDMPGQLVYSNVSSYCFQSPQPTGQVTMTSSCVVSIADKCSCPVTVWYQG
jgi:hypothetical protein